MKRKDFDLDYAIELYKKESGFNKDGSIRQPKNTIEYIDKYFYPNRKAVYYFWNGKEQDFEYYNKQEINMVYFDKLPAEIKKWFFKQNTKLYNVVCNFKLGRIDYERKIINLFKGLKHTKQKYKKFSDKMVFSYV